MLQDFKISIFLASVEKNSDLSIMGWYFPLAAITRRGAEPALFKLSSPGFLIVSGSQPRGTLFLGVSRNVWSLVWLSQLGMGCATGTSE